MVTLLNKILTSDSLNVLYGAYAAGINGLVKDGVIGDEAGPNIKQDSATVDAIGKNPVKLSSFVADLSDVIYGAVVSDRNHVIEKAGHSIGFTPRASRPAETTETIGTFRYSCSRRSC
jgi:hypothetical protein